jgi:tRNA U34 5-methylaminomethyl-2-thiouridine-forming methyltransferase MnmC
MPTELQIVPTSDGSTTLLNQHLNETYHSIHGAIQESRHVFIEAGLNGLLQCAQAKNISILEVGFGTGLNALLTALATNKLDIKIEYEAVEAFALPMKMVALLNYPEILNSEDSRTIFNKLHQCEWNKRQTISSNFILRKLDSKIQDVCFEKEKFDLVYFDAFAPSKQPEMWEKSILQKVTAAMKPQAIFVTYSATGQLKRDLVSLGLSVEKIPGPLGKREMIRAVKTN